VPAPDSRETEASLHDWAQRQMPKHMRPRHIRFIDDLPRTATNKIEKYKLKALFAQQMA